MSLTRKLSSRKVSVWPISSVCFSCMGKGENEKHCAPGGPAALLSIGLWNKAFMCPTAVPSALSETSWELVPKLSGKVNLTCRNVIILIWIHCSKVLHLPFSVLGLTWCALLTFFFFFFSPALCTQRLSTFTVCRETSNVQVQSRLSFFFFRELSIEQTKTCNPQKIVCCAGREAVGETARDKTGV